MPIKKTEVWLPESLLTFEPYYDRYIIEMPLSLAEQEGLLGIASVQPEVKVP